MSLRVINPSTMSLSSEDEEAIGEQACPLEHAKDTAWCTVGSVRGQPTEAFSKGEQACER